LLIGSGLVPIWVSAPLGLVAMVITAGHLIAMRSVRDRVPSSRRRIRTVNGFVILLTLPMLVFAFSFTTRETPAVFLRSWTISIGLLGIVLMLSFLDALNSFRLGRAAHREARDAFHAELEETRRRIKAAREADPNLRGGPLRLAGDERGEHDDG